MTDRDSLMEQLDMALERDLSEQLAAALNAEAHGPDPADQWRTLGAQLRECAGWADQLAGDAVREWTTDQVLTWLAEQGQPVARDTWGAYVRRGQAPAPLRRVGRTPVWSADDVRGWHGGRRGQSWRADAIRPVDPTVHLTPAQRDLYNRVIDRAGLDGSDCADVLAAMDANDIDRRAVTNALTYKP